MQRKVIDENDANWQAEKKVLVESAEYIPPSQEQSQMLADRNAKRTAENATELATLTEDLTSYDPERGNRQFDVDSRGNQVKDNWLKNWRRKIY